MTSEPSVFQRRRPAQATELAQIPWLQRLSPKERERASAAGLDFTKTENLYLFDKNPGFSLGQGE